MPHSTTLIVLGALSAAAIAVGIDLGRATVGQINPAYFKDPEPTFYAAPAASAPAGDWQQVQVQEYAAAAQGPPPPSACLQCAWPVDPTPLHDPAVDRALAPWTPRSEPVQAAVPEAPPDPPARHRRLHARSDPPAEAQEAPPWTREPPPDEDPDGP